MTYAVVKGDSPWRIAKANYSIGTKWNVIYEDNAEIILDPDMIDPDQFLLLL